jgi:hypothetical protein
MNFKCLREFPTLLEHEKPIYMINSGNKLITNTATFPGIPNSGTVIRGYGVTLTSLLAARNDSDAAEAAYQAHLLICLAAMEANYNDIDLVAAGSDTIIALAGVAATSDSTARTGVPGVFVDLKYSMTNFGGKIKVEWFFDNLSQGALVITSSDMTATLEQTGPLQLKLTVGTSIFYIDIATKSSAIVEHLIGNSMVRSRAVKFNPNGMCPMVTMNPVSVPVTS